MTFVLSPHLAPAGEEVGVVVMFLLEGFPQHSTSHWGM